MVSHCANPDCRRELHYLRDGKIYQFVLFPKTGSTQLEHFWLCGHCNRIYEFVFPSDGPVGLKVRGSQFTLDSIRATSFPARLTGIEGAQQTPQQN